MNDTAIRADEPLADLSALLRVHRDPFRAARPFPHCCLDGLVSDPLLDRVLSELPRADEAAWKPLEDEGKAYRKVISAGFDEAGPHTRELLASLTSPRFLGFLEELTGIAGLFPDPYLHSAGFHQYRTGGFLELHADFSWHYKLHAYRRVNLLLYLNKEWKEEYGGHLELWDKDLKTSVKLLPIWNRTVIHDVLPRAYHGLPRPITCPVEMTRKSLTIWYYTTELPVDQRIQYRLHEPNWVGAETPALSARGLKRLVPPIALELVRHPADVLKMFVPPIFFPRDP